MSAAGRTDRRPRGVPTTPRRCAISDAQQVPGPAADNNERIAARPSDDFARLPREEVTPIPEPGAGPGGGLDSGLSKPLLTVALGYALAFATFVIRSPVPLVLGLLLVVGGMVWSKRSQGRGSGSGLGPVTIRRD